jgi:H+-transporting ATPase
MKANIDQLGDPESKHKKPEPRLVSESDSNDDLKSLPLPEVEKRLGSSAKGLSQAEAQKRLAKYGPNEIKEKKDNLFLKFLSYFWGPIPWMIEGAVILSGVVRHWLDFFIILFLLFSNAVVAFWEEHQAGNEIAALRAKLATKARALRDGKWATPKVAELVPGDVIRLMLGDIVPADARLLAGDPVQVDQSAENLCQQRVTLARQSFRDRLSSAAKPTRWSMPPVPTPISARLRSWCRAPIPSATSSALCSRLAII